MCTYGTPRPTKSQVALTAQTLIMSGTVKLNMTAYLWISATRKQLAMWAAEWWQTDFDMKRRR